MQSEWSYTLVMLTKEQITDAIVNLTEDYTDVYFETFKRDMDKQLWAALHVGFISAMKLNGYSDTLLNAALADAQERMPDQTRNRDHRAPVAGSMLKAPGTSSAKTCPSERPREEAASPYPAALRGGR